MSRLVPRPVATALLSAVFVLAVLRFLAMLVGAVHTTHGDFFATLPGPYAERLNPSLWDSPDLVGGTWRHMHVYGYGPVMYLTLYPMVFLDSYRQIALALLPVYTAAIVGTGYLLWRLCQAVIPDRDATPGPWLQIMLVGSSLFLFTPLVIAFVQREFEVVQLLVFAAATLCVAKGRRLLAAGLLGYIVLFKYWPVGMLGYFILRRQWKASVVFIATIAAVLLLANAVFDLDYFPGQVAGVNSKFGFMTAGEPFCVPIGINQTHANLRAGVCAIVNGHQRLAVAGYCGLILAASAAFLLIFAALERRRSSMNEAQDRWRRTLELSFFIVAGPTFAHGHYYYLSVLIIPLTILLYKTGGIAREIEPVKFSLSVSAYLLLAAFVLPFSVSSRLLGRSALDLYNNHGLYTYGVVLLVGVLCWEYKDLLKTSASGQWPEATRQGAAVPLT